MYRTILVPLDGSRRAEAILPHVEAMAQSQNARVVFLEVMDGAPFFSSAPGTSGVWRDDTVSSWRTEAAMYLAGRQGEFRQLGIDATACGESGPVVETILCVAERVNADLIAMASHGRTGLARAFYGSVAAAVLQGADRPLMLVRSSD
jgi:nucleotide-binding universal stress UspA family protein